jgi:2'-5' RNA ligase
VEGGERLRLFLGLPLPDEPLRRLVRWQGNALAPARNARVVPPDNLHVTLAFLGSRPAEDVATVVALMREVAAEAERPVLIASRYRETRSVGMVVLTDEHGRAARLAERLGADLETHGVYERERRPWLPHVTVLRFRRPPRLSLAAPELGRFSPSEVALYHSVLRRTGAQYEIRESVALGG